MLQLKEIFYVANIIDYGRWVSGGKVDSRGTTTHHSICSGSSFFEAPKINIISPYLCHANIYTNIVLHRLKKYPDPPFQNVTTL
jgi:hypothetical protein